MQEELDGIEERLKYLCKNNTNNNDEELKELEELEEAKKFKTDLITLLKKTMLKLGIPGVLSQVIKRSNGKIQAMLKKSNYFTSNPSNVVVLTGLEKLEAKLGVKISEAELKRHFEQGDPIYCYDVLKTHRMEDQNIAITFKNSSTARDAVAGARQMSFWASYQDLDLVLMDTNDVIDGVPKCKSVKRAENLIKAMAVGPQ